MRHRLLLSAALCTCLAGVVAVVLHNSEPHKEVGQSPLHNSYIVEDHTEVKVSPPASTTTSTLPPATPEVAPEAPPPLEGATAPALPPPAPAPPEDPPAPPPAGCGDALAEVNAAGLYVPAGFAFYCPGTARDTDGSLHQGLTSTSEVIVWEDGRVEVHGGKIEVDTSRISSYARLRHVIAHEICHAIDLSTAPWTTSEGSAEGCAAAHGL